MRKQGCLEAERRAYRSRLAHRWRTRGIDEASLHRAWDIAHEVAVLLYAEFGATEVSVFGSLTEPMRFTKESDIDIVVSGLSDSAFDAAQGKMLDVDSEFRIDLINMAVLSGSFRARVMHQAIRVEKGRHPPHRMTAAAWRTLYEHLRRNVLPADPADMYEMTLKQLTQRLSDELGRIDETLARIQRGVVQIDVLPVQAREFIENTIATDLADVYGGVDRIFLRIAREVDMSVPSGRRWHKDLLAQMAEGCPERPAVISATTEHRLSQLLDFRGMVNNIYGRELSYEKTAVHAESIDALFTTFSQELNAFTAALAGYAEEV